MRKRQHREQVRLDDVEYAKFMALWNQSGLKKEPFLRQLVMTGYVRAKPSEAYYKLIAEINKIGVNINQIAKIANSDGHITSDSISHIRRLQEKLVDLVIQEEVE